MVLARVDIETLAVASGALVLSLFAPDLFHGSVALAVAFPKVYGINLAVYDWEAQSEREDGEY